ncbi:MAG: glutamate synthase small subunit, partial [Desulfuromonadales bacterium]|nr:glutamate synthase small subunit [Desulfuromonadales bacterium]NIS43789.1 glutamate synthase small subunit [Desulfuromonadales bacterium]
EYLNAVEEGVVFMFNEAPKGIVLDDDGSVGGVDAINTELGEPGPDGRQRVSEVEG